MALIRLLMPVAGDLADGVPAPAPRTPVEVPDHVADSWCDGERAERVEAVDSDDVQAVHADARLYLDAVLEQHAVEIEQLHADAREYLAAALAPQTGDKQTSKRGSKPDA